MQQQGRHPIVVTTEGAIHEIGLDWFLDMTPESKVKAQIKTYLKSIGAYQFWPVQTGYGSPALDCFACVKGRFISIEVKRPGVFKATPRQRLIAAEVVTAGGLAFVTDSLERTIKMINDHVLGDYDYARDD